MCILQSLWKSWPFDNYNLYDKRHLVQARRRVPAHVITEASTSDRQQRFEERSSVQRHRDDQGQCRA